MSGVLFIGPSEQFEIEAALKRAVANPTPWQALQAIAMGDDKPTLPLKDRPEGVGELRRKYPSQLVKLGSYIAAISFEHQPAGLFRHLSVSSRARDKVPGPEVMAMVAEAFGFSGWPPHGPSRVWLEEYEPGRNAVNVVELVPS